MAGYDCFANFYDLLTDDIDYKKAADFYVSCFERYGKKPEILLDLACGTGKLTYQFAEYGFDCIGVDASAQMLSYANLRYSDKILFLNQSADELDLFGTVQCAVCNLDSVNHFEPEILPDIFSKVALFLEKDGLFIFDVNTEYKFEKVLADNTFVYDLPNIYCVWQNYYSSADEILDIHLDIFENSHGCYNRLQEDFSEFYYSDSYLREILTANQLDVVDVVADFTLEKPNDFTQRIHYITRKRD